MKKRKRIIKDKKLRGEWAESVFMERATQHGLAVSKPWGEMCSYDFVVGKPGRFVSVQVKSTIMQEQGGYVCTVRSGHRGLAQPFTNLQKLGCPTFPRSWREGGLLAGALDEVVHASALSIAIGEQSCSIERTEDDAVRGVPVACELRSPATAFGRVELFSLFAPLTRPSKGRSSTVLPESGVESVEEPGFSPASGALS